MNLLKCEDEKKSFFEDDDYKKKKGRQKMTENFGAHWLPFGGLIQACACTDNYHHHHHHHYHHDDHHQLSPNTKYCYLCSCCRCLLPNCKQQSLQINTKLAFRVKQKFTRNQNIITHNHYQCTVHKSPCV